MNNYMMNNALGSEYWINAYNKSFEQIQVESNLPPIFLNKVNNLKNDIIQPVNGYAFYYSKKPKLINHKDYIVLRQFTHSEIWVEPKGNGLYALDKAWQRQFYVSDKILEGSDNCFSAMYKFYTPWIINKNIDVEVRSIKSSPFIIKSNNVIFGLNNCPWIYFLIKKTGKHMHSEKYGIININTPMFDLVIKDSNTIKEILKNYEK